MTDEQEFEWRAWGTVVCRLRSLGIEPDNPLMLDAIREWGERLALLRREVGFYFLDPAAFKQPLANLVGKTWQLPE